MKTALVSGVFFLSLLSPAVGMQKPHVTAAAPECANVHAHEPMLIYEVSGATLAGTIDRTLIVYADGALKLASAAPGELGTCASAQTTPDVAIDLYLALKDRGAMGLCDDEGLFVDLPLHTVTLLRGAHETRGRTFSYWNVDAGYAAVDALLEDFIAEQFPQ